MKTNLIVMTALWVAAGSAWGSSLRVTLEADLVASGEYNVRVYGEVLGGLANEGICDTQITLYTSGSTSVTAPKLNVVTGKVTLTWNATIPANFSTIDPLRQDWDLDGDMDALGMAFSDLQAYTATNLGIGGRVLLATQRWVILQSYRQVYLTVDAAPNSRHFDWSVPFPYKSAFTSVEGVGTYVGLPSTLRGTVELQDYVGDPQTVPIAVELRAGSTRSEVVFLDPLGRFEITDVIPGTYDVWVKGRPLGVGPGWLAEVKTGIVVAGDTTIPETFSLINGDSDGDNEVTTSDLANVLFAMNAMPGDPNWLPEADLDGDEEVTTSDLATVLLNMDLYGAP